MARTNEAFAQTIFDARALMRHVERAGSGPIGAFGMSLGAYAAALLATLEERLAFAVAMIPVASLTDLVWGEPLHHFRRREVEAHGVTLERFRELWQVHAPLLRPPLVPRERRFVIGALGDRICPPAQAPARALVPGRSPGPVPSRPRAARGPGLPRRARARARRRLMPVARFPAGFLWGTATAAHQVEGGNWNNDWWAWEHDREAPCQEPSGDACDHWHRWPDDLRLCAELGFGAYRFSLEWSRIEPEEGRFSDEDLAHYAEVIAALRERGMEPVVTLYHYTLPRWLARKGGWECGTVEDHFERYVDRVVEAYGDRVRWWLTMNEPAVHVFKSYVIGQWPPGKQDYPAALASLRSQAEAIYLAGLFLAVGAVDKTEAHLAKASTNEPLARALRTMIAAVAPPFVVPALAGQLANGKPVISNQ